MTVKEDPVVPSNQTTRDDPTSSDPTSSELTDLPDLESPPVAIAEPIAVEMPTTSTINHTQQTFQVVITHLGPDNFFHSPRIRIDGSQPQMLCNFASPEAKPAPLTRLSDAHWASFVEGILVAWGRNFKEAWRIFLIFLIAFALVALIALRFELGFLLVLIALSGTGLGIWHCTVRRSRYPKVIEASRPNYEAAGYSVRYQVLNCGKYGEVTIETLSQ